jgi:SAM-dependent methyltransferase
MIVLNLGCGSKTSTASEVINIDRSIALRIRNNPLMRRLAPIVFRGDRLSRFNALPNNIKVWNLAKGIPFADGSVDAVYHSHLLEHLDRTVAIDFLLECKRVLKRGGVLRIVVPDFETLCRKYLEHAVGSEQNVNEAELHEAYIASVIEQSVRKEAYGTSQQRPLRRLVENLLLGDARKRGEAHQWMYDRISLKLKLLKLGYSAVFYQEYNSSGVPNWDQYGLDIDINGNEYKPDSLYMEGIK